MWRLIDASTLGGDAASPRYEQIAGAIVSAIQAGRLRTGDRLPTVRGLAADLKVSVTTVHAAFRSLSDDGWIRGEIGRGTFVAKAAESVAPATGSPDPFNGRRWTGVKSPWRSRARAHSAERLRSAFPDAVDCSTGRPDPSLLPLKLLRRHWKSALDGLEEAELQYRTADPTPELEAALLPRLASDGIPAEAAGLVVGSSAQQLIGLAADVSARLWGRREPVIAVEQPGYCTIFDTWDRAGVRMIGVQTDEHGARPDSLADAIERGANTALFTPRALNPTGASWSVERRQALADVLTRHPRVLVVEDDHFGDISVERPGSLLDDERLERQVIYVRSFSKSIAPDLRLAVAAAHSPARALLRDAKSHADGWTSRLLQRVLARLLSDQSLNSWLERARDQYRLRRQRAMETIATLAPAGVSTWAGRDGVNLWIHLPPAVEATDVLERAAALGVLVAPGEPFYLGPGHEDVLRFNAGSVDTNKVAACAKLLVQAIQQCQGTHSTMIHV